MTNRAAAGNRTAMSTAPVEGRDAERNAPRRGKNRLVLSCLSLTAAIACGCAPRATTIDLVSYKDPYFPEPYYVKFDECVHRVGPGGDHFLIARATSKDADIPVRHYFDVSVYWRPRPGKTPTHSSTMDAVLRYAVVTPSGCALYRGNGFVYLRQDALTHAWIGKLESGHLRLESSTGSLGAAATTSAPATVTPHEILGDSRVSGQFVAKDDANRAVDLLRELNVTTAASSAAPVVP